MNISDLAEDYLVDVPIEIGTLSPVGERSKRGNEEVNGRLSK